MLLDKIAKRIQDPQVMHFVKQIIKVGVKLGIPQGGPFSPLAANIYLNEVLVLRCASPQNGGRDYEAINYHWPGGATPMPELDVEMKVRTLLTRRK